MAEFHPIKVADVYKETDECAVVSFEIPESLREQFRYNQGQHLTLRTQIDGEDVRRSYSLCSSPDEGIWKVAVKQLEGGLFSTWLNKNLKRGDYLQVMTPEGKFSANSSPETQKNYLAFAAGSGITPILSMIKTHLGREPQSTFRLFYLNKNVKSIIFKEEIEALKNKYLERFEVYYFLTKEHRDIPLFNGRFTAEKIQTAAKHLFDPQEIDDVFLCGPESMIFMIRDELQSLGMASNKIHFELFTSGNTEESKKRIREVLEKKVEGTEVTVIDGGKEFHFIMSNDFDNILDGALSAGADLPFACKGGVCSTCRCKIVEGTAEMKINYALEEADLNKGIVLSCQAVPTSGKLVVDFDV
jgi:ring-1,2-phenylacetyl-CoA epoxidase subunit PaaE